MSLSVAGFGAIQTYTVPAPATVEPLPEVPAVAPVEDTSSSNLSYDAAWSEGAIYEPSAPVEEDLTYAPPASGGAETDVYEPIGYEKTTVSAELDAMLEADTAPAEDQGGQAYAAEESPPADVYEPIGYTEVSIDSELDAALETESADYADSYYKVSYDEAEIFSGTGLDESGAAAESAEPAGVDWSGDGDSDDAFSMAAYGAAGNEAVIAASDEVGSFDVPAAGESQYASPAASFNTFGFSAMQAVAPGMPGSASVAAPQQAASSEVVAQAAYAMVANASVAAASSVYDISKYA